jgi:hypothetical protein
LRKKYRQQPTLILVHGWHKHCCLAIKETYLSQVATQEGVPPNCLWEFSGLLFQPVPWSVNTRFGMPQVSNRLYKSFVHEDALRTPGPFQIAAVNLVSGILFTVLRLVLVVQYRTEVAAFAFPREQWEKPRT